MTQLFLTAIPSDNAGSGELLMAPNRGAISTSRITNTTGSGTSIQETATGGGTAIVYLSEPLAAGIVFTSGSTTITANERGKEAAIGNNAGVGGILAVVDNANSSVLATLLAETGYPTTAGITEFTTTDAAKVLTSTTIGASYTTTGGERLRYTVKIKNVGTMGAGTPGVTTTINGPTAAAAGDSSVTPGATLTPQAITGKARQIKPNFLLDGPATHATWPTTFDFNVVANAAIMVRLSWDNSGSGGASTTVASVTDSQGHTYTALASTFVHDTTNGNDSQVFYLPGGTATAGGLTVTANPGAGTGFINPTMTIEEYPGMGTVSSSNANNANGSTAANNVTGGAVTSLAGDTVIGLYWDDGGTGTSQPVAGTGYTMRQAGIETTFNTPHAAEEKVNVTAGTQEAKFTAGNADWYICQTVSLSVLAASAAPKLPVVVNRAALIRSNS